MPEIPSPEEFFETSFFEALRGGSRVPCTPSPSARMADFWGVSLAPSLEKLLDFLGEQPEAARPRLGELYAFAPGDWIPSGNAFEFMLREWFRRAALLDGMIPIGTSGSGDIWFAEVAFGEPLEGAPRTRVFLLDHDLSEVAIVADSIEAFALFSELSERETELTADAWRPLAGRIRRTNDMRAPTPMLEAEGEVSARHAAVDELLGCLWFRHVPKPREVESPANAMAPELIEGMLRHYLREEDVALDRLLEIGTMHRAAIVRDAALILGSNRALRGFDLRYEALKAG